MELKTTSTGKEKNDGIEILRIVSMFFVLVLHTLLLGGMLSEVEGQEVIYNVSWLMESIALGAVDIFAIISGYVGYTEKPRKYRVSSFVMLWLMVLTYSVGLALIENAIIPEAITVKDIQMSFFPVTSRWYWYFTCYTGLFVLMPVLDYAVRALPKKKLKMILLGIILLFSVYNIWFGRFELESGYSTIWLVLLYLIGAIIKKCEIGVNLKARTLIAVIVAGNLITWMWMILIQPFDILCFSFTKETLVQYISPTVLLPSIAYVILFSRIKLKKGGDIQNVIRFFSPAVFAAYIINTHPFLWFHFIPERLIHMRSEGLASVIFSVIFFSLLFLVAAVLIERLRMLLVKLLRIRQGIEWVEAKVRGWIQARSGSS
ncbi:MAG: acyltransferase [Eubacterium sp.]|nr:acyltransferase [Eubacterium sp.]